MGAQRGRCLRRCPLLQVRLTWGQRVWLLLISAVLAVCFIGIATGDALLWAAALEDAIDAFELGPMAVSLFALYVVLVVCGVPNILLCVGCATLYARKLDFWSAFALSVLLAFMALVLGGLAAREIGASVLRSWSERMRGASRTFRVLDGALARDGASVSALMRTSLPHALVNYGMASIACSRASFALGMVGHLPFATLYSYLGCSLRSIVELAQIGAAAADLSNRSGASNSSTACSNSSSGGGGGGSSSACSREAEALRSWIGLGGLILTSLVLSFVAQRSFVRLMRKERTAAEAAGAPV